MSKNGNKPDKSVLMQWPIHQWEWPRILLYIPMFPALPHAPAVFYDFMEIAAQGPYMLRGGYARTDVARNSAAKRLLDTNCTHILMLDADHRHPINIIQRLASWVIEDPERLIIGGMNFRRGEPFDPMAGVLGDDGELYIPDTWEGGLIEVDKVATGAILIAREVFEILDKPYFYYPYNKVDEDIYPSEDYPFCDKCRKAGIKIYCDTALISPHAMTAFVDASTYKSYIEQHPDVLGDEKVVKEHILWQE